jgi:MFS transporter, Spinster family, sphingosine-1-phosphate transporter
METDEISGEQKKHAVRVLIILTLVHFINYVDRQIIFPLFHYIKPEFNLSDFELGLLATSFLLVYSFFSIPFGLLADKKIRKNIIGFGLLFWSLVTSISGFAKNYLHLFLSRALVGVGEASYAPAATSLLSDLFPASQRSRVMSIYNIGLYLGGAVGMSLAGIMGETIGWRASFFIVGLPGLLICFFVFRIKEKKRIVISTYGVLKNFKDLFTNPIYNYVLAGATFIAFSSGSILSWAFEFTMRYHNFGVQEASITIGLIAMLGGISGVLSGGWISDHLYKFYKSARAITISVSFLISTPFLALTLTATSKMAFLSYLFLSSYFMCWYFGPIIAMIQESVNEHFKATALAFYFFFIHIFGDALAPSIIGKISDLSSLKSAFVLPVVSNFLCGIVFLLAIRKIIKMNRGFIHREDRGVNC